MENKNDTCCVKTKTIEGNNIVRAIGYSILPHTFCIAFILFSVIGAVSATAFLKNFLIIPYFFEFLMGVSLLLATISGAIYLKRANCLCFSGIKTKWKYITILYFTMILVNVMMFTVVFPTMANINNDKTESTGQYSANLLIAVKIPCTGHAQLIIDEIKADKGVGTVSFRSPNKFNIKYDPTQTSPIKISSMEIFKTFETVIR